MTRPTKQERRRRSNARKREFEVRWRLGEFEDRWRCLVGISAGRRKAHLHIDSKRQLSRGSYSYTVCNTLSWINMDCVNPYDTQVHSAYGVRGICKRCVIAAMRLLYEEAENDSV